MTDATKASRFGTTGTDEGESEGESPPPTFVCACCDETHECSLIGGQWYRMRGIHVGEKKELEAE
jgi:hypothetical protein